MAKSNAGWWIAGIAATALTVSAIASARNTPFGFATIRIIPHPNGTFTFEAVENGVVVESQGPFATAAAANAAADIWLAGQAAPAPVEDPPVVPPIPQAAYVRVTGGGVTGEAFATTTGVRWVVGALAGTAANAIIGTRDMLAAVDAAAAKGQPMEVEWRRGNGSIARARVARQSVGGPDPTFVWRWATLTPGSPPLSNIAWVSPIRLGALRGAVTTLQAGG